MFQILVFTFAHHSQNAEFLDSNDGLALTLTIELRRKASKSVEAIPLSSVAKLEERERKKCFQPFTSKITDT